MSAFFTGIKHRKDYESSLKKYFHGKHAVIKYNRH